MNKATLTRYLEKARCLAKQKHKRQKYLLDRPYFEAHIEQVVGEVELQMPPERYTEREILEAKTIAYLHDILEDTDVTKEYLEMEFGTDIANSVDLLTKRKGTEYMAYISGLRQDRMSMLVKKADATVNLRSSIISGERKRIHKYVQVIDALI